MRWLLSLILGLLLAWSIVLYVNKNTSTYTMAMDPIDIKNSQDPLVGVGLAQYPESKSIMDSIDQPVPFSYGPAPNLQIIEGSTPDPNFVPSPEPPGPSPSPVPASPSPSPVPASPSPSPVPASPSPGPSVQS